AALEMAWRAVVERHGALRLGFRWRGLAYPTQGIGAGVTAPWSVLDLRGEGAYARALRDLQERELRTTFDVERPPLHRLCVVRSPDGSLDLIWTYFSALLDGWSSVIVLRDLVAHYAAAVRGAPPPAPAPHFFDHLDRMAARDWSASEPFFREALAGYRPPPSIGRPPGGDDQERSTAALPSELRLLFEALGDKPFRTQGVGAKSARLSEADTARLGLAAARHGVAESTILQSAWAIALMREYGCDDILVGMVAANRPDYEAAVGKYTSMLPFRFRLGRPRPLGDWLRGNERYVLETLAHEGVPSERWVGAIGLERWQFPFESTFTFVNYVARAGGGGGDGPPRVTHCRQLDAGIPPAFGMVVIPGESHLARLEYNRAGGFDEARLEGLLDAFLDALARLSGSPAEADVASWLGGTLGARSFGVRLGLL
ncbi:MAG TPA: condensation domain-containing protein, partial [Polyangiaceae bacterium]|nr:condensation domain-containing protein [Polyangiaceae bacterium]